MTNKDLYRFLRNAAIGAVACSYRALFYRAWDVLLVLLPVGALSGLLYTALEPMVRHRPYLHYVPWVLCAYLVLFGGVGLAGLLAHDQESIEVFKNPWFVGLILIIGPIGAYAAARTFEDD